ncbi:MAG: hypothetical protein KIT22_12740 [Verrucomicrobiae bacterium]|nr:hypothetical protein [Verrucomicrobiae bacterium]
MNITKSTSQLAIAGGLLIASQSAGLAASIDTFGPWTSVGSSDTLTLDIPGPSGSITFDATFSASGTFRAADGTPNDTLESYTIKYASVQLTLTSANGILATDPYTLSFTDVSVVVDYLTPATGAPSTWADIPYTLTATPLSVSIPYSGAGAVESFDVEWTFLSALSITGGKGVDSFTENPVLSGSLTAVPEPGAYAFAAGLGLLAFAGLRTSRR